MGSHQRVHVCQLCCAVRVSTDLPFTSPCNSLQPRAAASLLDKQGSGSDNSEGEEAEGEGEGDGEGEDEEEEDQDEDDDR